ncbi:MAG: MBL fold metallo-hydrolase [Proteobacteria bacterium]|nr:MBL fold metallo-hydrolase [Pseudomonadota bacterium]
MKRRVIPVLAAVLILATASGLLLSEPVRNALADRMIRRNLKSVDRGLLEQDSLNMVLVGSGGPIANDVRSSPCLAVFAGRTAFLVDVGPGAWKNINRFRLPADRFEFVLLTHFHSDHIGDLGEFSMQTWAAGRSRPLTVYGPPGVEKVVAGFRTAYELDARYRVLHHGEATMPPAAGGMNAAIVNPAGLGSALVRDYDGLKITAFLVDHHPVEAACGYRIEYKGRTLVVSGDTSKNENVARHARGADLLVHNVLSEALTSRISRVAAEEAMPRLAKITADIPTYHATPVQAAETAREAGVKMLALAHITPPLPNWMARNMFMKGVKAAWAGETVLGEDGLLFRLPAGSGKIEIQELG